MSDFGFDANIILQGPRLAMERAEADNARSQSRLTQARTAQANYDMQRQQSLRDLIAQNPGAYTDPTAQALARGGFLDQAEAAQQQAAQRQASAAKLMQLHADITRSQLASAAPEQTQRILDNMQDDVRDRYGLPKQYDPADPEHAKAVQSFIASGMAPEQQAGYLDAQRRRGALADPNTATYRAQAAFLAKLGIPVEPGMNLNDVSDKAEGIAEKLTGAQLLAGSRVTAAETGADARVTAAETAAQARRDAARAHGGGTPVPVDENTLNFEADQFSRTNKFVNSGRGKEALAHNQAVMKRAIERHPDMDPVAAAAALKADTASLQHATTQADAVNSFTRTFDKNVGILEKAVADLPSSDNALFNKGYRAWQGARGSPQLTTFQNALNTVRSELGKINSGSTGAGGVPVSLLQEMEHGLPDSATPAQVLAALKVYRQDSANRAAAMSEQIGATKGRISGKPVGGASVDHSAAAEWLRDPTSKSDPNYGAALAAYKKAHGGQEP